MNFGRRYYERSLGGLWLPNVHQSVQMGFCCCTPQNTPVVDCSYCNEIMPSGVWVSIQASVCIAYGCSFSPRIDDSIDLGDYLCPVRPTDPYAWSQCFAVPANACSGHYSVSVSGYFFCYGFSFGFVVRSGTCTSSGTSLGSASYTIFASDLGLPPDPTAECWAAYGGESGLTLPLANYSGFGCSTPPAAITIAPST